MNTPSWTWFSGSFRTVSLLSIWRGGDYDVANKKVAAYLYFQLTVFLLFTNQDCLSGLACRGAAGFYLAEAGVVNVAGDDLDECRGDVGRGHPAELRQLQADPLLAGYAHHLPHAALELPLGDEDRVVLLHVDDAAVADIYDVLVPRDGHPYEVQHLALRYLERGVPALFPHEVVVVEGGYHGQLGEGGGRGFLP